MDIEDVLHNFQQEVEDFLVTTGMDATAFGRNALKDPTFVFALRDGRQPRFTTIKRVQTYMQSVLAETAA